MFDQIFPSPQVKRSVIITNKHGIQVVRRCSILTGVLRNFAKSTETTRARARPQQNRSPRPATAPKKRPRPGLPPPPQISQSLQQHPHPPQNTPSARPPPHPHIRQGRLPTTDNPKTTNHGYIKARRPYP